MVLRDKRELTQEFFPAPDERPAKARDEKRFGCAGFRLDAFHMAKAARRVLDFTEKASAAKKAAPEGDLANAIRELERAKICAKPEKAEEAAATIKHLTSNAGGLSEGPSLGTIESNAEKLAANRDEKARHELVDQQRKAHGEPPRAHLEQGAISGYDRKAAGKGSPCRGRSANCSNLGSGSRSVALYSASVACRARASPGRRLCAGSWMWEM